MNALGYMYYNGIGVEISKIKALKYFKSKYNKIDSNDKKDLNGIYNYGQFHLINHNELNYPEDNTLVIN